ncbi:MAG: histidine-type phosphatase, partial [Bacteroidales bacterium]|nr:histidine-type phosphatase [Bacteroidales bacterium]
ASNIQLVFYRSRKAGQDILVKCLLNGYEVTLPVKTDTFPYYKWSDLRAFYRQRIDNVPQMTD